MQQIVSFHLKRAVIVQLLLLNRKRIVNHLVWLNSQEVIRSSYRELDPNNGKSRQKFRGIEQSEQKSLKKQQNVAPLRKNATVTFDLTI